MNLQTLTLYKNDIFAAHQSVCCGLNQVIVSQSTDAEQQLLLMTIIIDTVHLFLRQDDSSLSNSCQFDLATRDLFVPDFIPHGHFQFEGSQVFLCQSDMIESAHLIRSTKMPDDYFCALYVCQESLSCL
jgi:hypothetical protein